MSDNKETEAVIELEQSHTESERIAQEKLVIQEKLAKLERLGKEAKLKEAKAKINRGALPVVQVLPVPEDDGTVAKIPTFFARIPIFSAGKPGHAPPEGEQLDTAFGRVIRFGPGLSMSDEDVFMHTFRVCQQKLLRGPTIAHKGLSVVSLLGEDSSNLSKQQIEQMLAEVDVVAGEASYYHIAATLNRARAEPTQERRQVGGATVDDIKDRLERMARVNIKIWRPDVKIFTYMHLFYLSGDEDHEGKANDGSSFTIYFHPGVVEMMRIYTLQDLSIRYQLSDVGKAVYRYCSSQLWGTRLELRISLEKLQPYTGTKSPLKRFREMVDHGFCAPILKTGWATRAEIVGTGRSKPLMLVIERPARRR